MKKYIVKVYEDRTEWLKNGKLHREDGPAIEYTDGNKEWYKNGKSHREDGPAVECSNGTKSWYLNGKPHREDGPAVECSNGYKAWYLNGKYHREDGPAVIKANGSKEWYLNDVKLTEQEFGKRIKNSNTIKAISKEELLKAIKDLYAVLGPSLPTSLKCKGCQIEWLKALDILKPIIKKLNV